MDFASLTTFISVAEHASFSLAAERLHLTQPAVSKRIAVLESSLDCVLFDRMGHQIQLTEAGKTLLPRARQMLLTLGDIQRELANLSGRVSGPLSIGTSHHIGLHRLAPTLHHYHRTFPEVELDLAFLASEDACQTVLQGELELAIVTLPPIPPERLLCTPVWRDELQLVVSVDHPLARYQSLTARQLANHPAILPEPGTFTRSLIDEALLNQGVAPQVAMQTNYLETIKMLVSVGLGWSLLPSNMLDETICSVALEQISVCRQLGVVMHSARTPSNAAQALLKLLYAKRT